MESITGSPELNTRDTDGTLFSERLIYRGVHKRESIVMERSRMNVLGIINPEVGLVV
jgi:hypothetical protein